MRRLTGFRCARCVKWEYWLHVIHLASRIEMFTKLEYKLSFSVFKTYFISNKLKQAQTNVFNFQLQGYRPAPAMIWNIIYVSFFEAIIAALLPLWASIWNNGSNFSLGEIGNTKIWMFNERYRRSNFSKRTKKKWILCQISVL